jgi:hypothetical protein
MEFDQDKLPASIDVAEKAIYQRLRGLPIANSKQHRKLRVSITYLFWLPPARLQMAPLIARVAKIGQFGGDSSATLWR